MELPISDRFLLGSDDLATAILIHGRSRSSAVSRIFRVVAYSILATFSFVVAMAFWFNPSPPTMMGPDPKLVVATVLASVWILLLVRPLYQGLEACKQVRGLYGRLDQAWSIDGVGLIAETTRGAQIFPWNSCVRVVESRKLFLFYSHHKTHEILPTRGFASGEDVECFVTLARQHVGDYILVEPAEFLRKPDQFGPGVS